MPALFPAYLNRNLFYQLISPSSPIVTFFISDPLEKNISPGDSTLPDRDSKTISLTPPIASALALKSSCITLSRSVVKACRMYDSDEIDAPAANNMAMTQTVTTSSIKVNPHRPLVTAGEDFMTAIFRAREISLYSSEILRDFIYRRNNRYGH